MLNPTKFVKQVEIQVRQLYTHVKLNSKSHYDTLGISPKATQADIKSAYYKLSMVHHPDKNTNSEGASTKFRDITEAYEVLGNVRTRKLYDRGLLFSHAGTASDEVPLQKFYQSRDTKSRPPTAYGRTTVYDFDEWSRAHYGATFQKSMRFKEKERMRQQRTQQNIEDIKQEKVVFLVGLFLLMAAYLFYDRDYDVPANVTVFGTNVIVSDKSEKCK